MKRASLYRVTAWFYIFSAVLGIVLGMLAGIGLWMTRERVTLQLTELGALAGRTLEATQLTIDVTGRTLDQAAVDLELIAAMLSNLGGTLDSSGGLISSTADLVGEDMVDFVGDTQASLTSVQNSARFIDDFLGIISSVPFIGGRYRPDVPLTESVSRVSASLDPLPEAFSKISADLDTASANAATLERQIETLSEQVAEIKDTVVEARAVVDEYHGILADTRDRYDAVRERFTVWSNVIYGALTVFLVWLVISQLAALLHGISELRER